MPTQVACIPSRPRPNQTRVLICSHWSQEIQFTQPTTSLSVKNRVANDYDRDQIFEIDCPQKSILIDYWANRLPTATRRSTTPILNLEVDYDLRVDQSIIVATLVKKCLS